MKTKLFNTIKWALTDAAELNHASLVERLANIHAAVDLLQRVLDEHARKAGRKVAKKIAEAREAGDASYAEGFNDGLNKARSATAADGWLNQLTDVSNLSKWSDCYVRRLGLLEHCDEILALHRAEAVAKAEGRRGAVEPAIARETADLWCILEMCRRADEGFRALCETRAVKFRP